MGPCSIAEMTIVLTSEGMIDPAGLVGDHTTMASIRNAACPAPSSTTDHSSSRSVNTLPTAGREKSSNSSVTFPTVGMVGTGGGTIVEGDGDGMVVTGSTTTGGATVSSGPPGFIVAGGLETPPTVVAHVAVVEPAEGPQAMGGTLLEPPAPDTAPGDPLTPVTGFGGLVVPRDPELWRDACGSGCALDHAMIEVIEPGVLKYSNMSTASGLPGMVEGSSRTDSHPGAAAGARSGREHHLGEHLLGGGDRFRPLGVGAGGSRTGPGGRRGGGRVADAGSHRRRRPLAGHDLRGQRGFGQRPGGQARRRHLGAAGDDDGHRQEHGQAREGTPRAGAGTGR